ncbi:hypothetical protein D1007_61553 [Hordeum vulgare]|nr:hypothetical protein D1007_61553 [Hordeum vulgare]
MTPPPPLCTGARRCLVSLGLPLASPPSGSRSGRSGTWSPEALRLVNGASNGVAPATHLHDGSYSEDERDGRSSCRWWCGRPAVGVFACAQSGRHALPGVVWRNLLRPPTRGSAALRPGRGLSTSCRRNGRPAMAVAARVGRGDWGWMLAGNRYPWPLDPYPIG